MPEAKQQPEVKRMPEAKQQPAVKRMPEAKQQPEAKRMPLVTVGAMRLEPGVEALPVEVLPVVAWSLNWQKRRTPDCWKAGFPPNPRMRRTAVFGEESQQ